MNNQTVGIIIILCAVLILFTYLTAKMTLPPDTIIIDRTYSYDHGKNAGSIMITAQSQSFVKGTDSSSSTVDIPDTNPDATVKNYNNQDLINAIWESDFYNGNN